MAISAYAVSLPLLLWMMPVVLGLLLAIPLATAASSRQTGSGLFRTPEEISPPRVLARANELAQTTRHEVSCPLLELRRDAELRDAHLGNLADPRPRRRGDVDQHLAVARAKIEDAETFDEAVAFLTSRETFAVLNSRAIFDELMALPSPNRRG
jgi:membrane glycosyltransferase